MRRRKVTIVSAIQITDNPRVVKEADAISEIGVDVEVLGAIQSQAALKRIKTFLADRRWVHTPVIDSTSLAPSAVVRHGMMRASTRIWRVALKRFKLENQRQLGPQTMALSRSALSTHADLYSLHLEAALWTGKALIDRALPFTIDMEDWYSEDGLPADRSVRPTGLMKRLERQLLHHAVHATTTSYAMAQALAEEYSCPTPEVIHNSFPTEERERVDGMMLDRKSTAIPSIMWFSQTIGPGRGLETLIEALSLLDHPLELHLRGTPREGYIDRLLGPLAANKRQRVFVHPQTPQAELLSRIMEHDIGYCGELSNCRSRHLTISNKALEYMRAGLAIVASDTAGQKEVAARAPDAVTLFRQEDAQALVESLRVLIESPERLRDARQASWMRFDERFGWGASKKKLQERVSRFFEERDRRETTTDRQSRWA